MPRVTQSEHGSATSVRRVWTDLFCLVVVMYAARTGVGASSDGGHGGRQALLSRAIQTYSSAMETKDRDARIQAFAESEQLFRQLIAGSDQHASVRNVALLVNMGNAALQAERVGPAILAYRRALLLDPAHLQARQNLRYARAAIPESVRQESTSGLIDTLFFWRTLYPRHQVFDLGRTMFSGGSGTCGGQPFAPRAAVS